MQSNGISKRIVYAGSPEYPCFETGTRALFHCQTKTVLEDKVVDDSRDYSSEPLELVIGKKFKFEVWEQCLQTMNVGEVSEFTVNESLCMNYPVVASQLRRIKEGKQVQSQCCGVMQLSGGVGYPTLDELIRKPQPLKFTIELLKAESPDSYEKHLWMLNETEKLSSLPGLREEGNILFRNKSFSEAAQKYSQALSHIDDLLLKEKPGDAEWSKFDLMKVPYLLNLSMCEFSLGEFYGAIDHTTEVLNRDPENVKALFRRAKARAEIWEADGAKEDFEKASLLDPTLKKAIAKELQSIKQKQLSSDKIEKEALKGKLFS